MPYEYRAIHAETSAGSGILDPQLEALLARSSFGQELDMSPLRLAGQWKRARSLLVSRANGCHHAWDERTSISRSSNVTPPLQ